jgi:hypothetical protein
MKEHIVQNTEQLKEIAFDAPTPMVERAFQLLDLLIASEEGMTLSDLARALNEWERSI